MATSVQISLMPVGAAHRQAAVVEVGRDAQRRPVVVQQERRRHRELAAVGRGRRPLRPQQDRLDQYAAERFGLNRTDLRALDLIAQAGTTSPTALAAALGMSTGATSTVLDRLEAAGYASRQPDPHHRRRTLVRTTPRTEQLSAEIFGPVIRATAEHAAGHPERALRVIADFLAAHRRTLESCLDAQNRNPG
jgi:DNA-binding MarR family transcriptional regulator